MSIQVELNQSLRCPACKSGLNFENENNTITCENNHSFLQKGSIPNLTFPVELIGLDATYFEQYKEIAGFYDQASAQLFAMHGGKEIEARSSMVDMLGLKLGDRVLEISAGTGLNIPYIINAVGDRGSVVALDLSPSMLGVAYSKFDKKKNVEFILSNASYLPFDDESFDAVFHVGGINTFTEKQLAINEIQRVVKTGGKVVLSDEGMGPWNLGTEYGDKLIRINGLYRDQPPIELLPVEIEDVRLSWVLGNVFYILEWRKRADQPILTPQQ